jgi:tetratricopeptide (TPR) repeat protein
VVAKKEQTEDIGQLLDQLATDEGKAELVADLAGEAYIPEKYVDSVINFFESNGMRTRAAKLAAKEGLTERAVKICKKGKNCCDIAGTAREAGLVEMAIKYYKKGKSYYGAAKVAEEAGMTERAIDLYLKSHTPFYAVGVAERAGMFKKAVEMCERLNCPEYGSEMAEKAGMHEKANELRIKAIETRRKSGRNILDTAKMAEKWGFCGKAQELYAEAVDIQEKKKDFLGAAFAAEKAGMIDTAIECYERCEHNLDTAARFAKKHGRDDKARDFFFMFVVYNGGILETDNIARLAMDLELFDEAIKIYERRGFFRDAAKCAEKAGLKEKAELYRKIDFLVSDES